MGLTKQYLRYVPAGSFNIIASARCNVVFVTLEGQEGRYVAVGACEDVIVWDLRLGEKAVVLAGEKCAATCLAASPDSRRLAAGYSDGVVKLFELGSGESAACFSGHKAAVTSLAYDPDGHRLASGSLDADVIVWDAVAEAGLHRLKGHKNAVTQVCFLAVRNVLVSASKDATVRMWDLDTAHCFHTLVGHTSEVWGLAPVKGDKYLLSGSADRQLRVWGLRFKDKSPGLEEKFDRTVTVSGEADEEEDDSESTTPLQCPEVGALARSGRGRVVSLARDPSGQVAVCHGTDNTVEVYYFCPEEHARLLRKKRLHKLRRKAAKAGGELEESADSEPILKDEVRRVCVIRAGGTVKSAAVVMGRGNEIRVAVALAGNAVELHSVRGVEKDSETSCLRSVRSQGHGSEVRAVAFSSDGLAVATAGAEAVKLWNRPSLACLRTVSTDYVLSLCFVPGDRHILAGLKDGRLLIVDIAAGDILEEIPAHTKELWSVSVLPDQRGCVTAGGDATVKLWQFELVGDPQGEGRAKVLSVLHLRTLKLDESVLASTVTPNSRLLAVALLDSTVKVFFLDTLKFFLSLYGHKLPVSCLDISSDSALVATGSADRTVKLWGLDFGDCHRSLLAHDDSVTALRFVPGTHQFFTCGKDGRLKHWDADSHQKILTLEGHRGAAWSLAVSPSGQHVVSTGADRVARVYERSQEPLVLEDEQEEERAREEETALATGEGPDRNLPSRKTVGSEQAAEQLMECLDVCREYGAQLDEHRTLCRAAKGRDPPPAPPPPALMAAYKVSTPDDFLLEVLSRIRTSDTEEALLLLPFPAVCQLLGALPALFERGRHTEQLGRVLGSLLRTHHGPIVATPSLLPVVERLRAAAVPSVQRLRDMVGLNLHALGFVQRQIEAREGVQLFRDATLSRREREKRSRKKERTRKRALLVL
ncbi:WD repeat-containing protein 3 [Bacillus rossius redtenbacheri]|uniref:WD repeat-containing protein 3 n=1 Tax=Bacillus rossius redtenbacheri TaxID=93214 RepID=UPI002FDD4C30